MYSKEDKFRLNRVFNAPSNYYEDVKLNYRTRQVYCETITLLETGEVVISIWTPTPQGVQEDARQVFYPSERDWKLIKDVHGEIQTGETRTTLRIWQGIITCDVCSPPKDSKNS